MAVPISNTHLRVPRGFGAILEGLTREILRDQPKDIPKYAAAYFEALLKQRDESGIDPSDWAAKLEDRYYNNHSFKTSEKDLVSKAPISNENSPRSHTEDYSGHSEEDVSLSSTKPIVPEDSDLEKTTEEQEDCTVTQEDSVSGLANVESHELSGSEEVKDQAFTSLGQADRSPNENNNSTGSNQTISHSDSETCDLQLLSEAANIDVCSQEVGESQTGGETFKKDDDQQLTVVEEEGDPIDVDFSTSEIALEEKTAVDGADADQDVTLSETRLQSPVSQLETTEHVPQEEETNDKESEVVASVQDAVHSDNKTMQESLVEVSFEDVPESQQSMDNENEQAININTATVDTEDHKETTREDEEANNSDLSDHDESCREESVENIGKIHQSNSESENQEDENNYVVDDEDKSNQKEHSENPDFREETNPTGEDTDEIQTEGYLQLEHQEMNDRDDESDKSQLTQSDVKTLQLEEQDETLDSRANDMKEQNEEEQQPGNNVENVPTTSQELHSEAEEVMEKEKLDSDIQEDPSKCEQDSIIPDVEERADQMATGLQEKQQPHGSQRDTSDPEGETNDKQEECSRPQEEEDIMDIPLDDPEANRAAAKIQAGFRGHMTRKKMKPEDKTEGEEVSSTGEVLNGSQGGTETGGSRTVGRDSTSVPEQ